MKKHKNSVIKGHESQNNVYLSHIEEDRWNDLRAYHIENETMWKNLAILSILGLFVVSIVAMYMVNQDKHKVLVFAKDDLGNLTALGLANNTLNIDNKIVAHQLANFIVALREVPIDIAVKRRNIDLVHKMLDPNLKANIDKMLINQYSKSGDKPITVIIHNIKPIAGSNSWIVDWSEQLDLDNGAQITSWSSEITFKKVEINDPNVQIVNPAGLIISYLHPTQDINSKGW